jgi:uncharacterized membrane protein YfcA
LSPIEILALAVAAFLAGAVNAVAGGGTLIAFPALLGIGYPAKVANVTTTLSVLPGTLGGSLAYRAEISRQWRTIKAVIPSLILGTIVGSALLLATPDSTFDWVVPFLIYGACVLLLLQDKLLARFFKGERSLDHGAGLLILRLGVFGVAVYGGYFGAAMGIIMLALFGIVLPEDIQHANALKGLCSLLINSVAAVYFALFGDVAWEAAAVMAVTSLAGGYIGVSIARRLPRKQLRGFAALYGLVAATVLLARNF